jgi:uncharacterized protein with GYD domain
MFFSAWHSYSLDTVDRSRNKKCQGFSVNRAEAVKKEAEKLGAKITPYWTLGEYDGVGILEAPDDKTAMQFDLKVGSLGNIRTVTLRAFKEEEIADMIGKLG